MYVYERLCTVHKYFLLELIPHKHFRRLNDCEKKTEIQIVSQVQVFLQKVKSFFITF